MTVAPVQDLIVDVMAAADPAAQRVAAEQARAHDAGHRSEFRRGGRPENRSRRREQSAASAAGRRGSDPSAALDGAGHARSSSRRPATAPSIASSKRSFCRCSWNRCCQRMPTTCSAKARLERSGARCSPSRSATRWPRATGLELQSSWEVDEPPRTPRRPRADGCGRHYEEGSAWKTNERAQCGQIRHRRAIAWSGGDRRAGRWRNSCRPLPANSNSSPASGSEPAPAR